MQKLRCGRIWTPTVEYDDLRWLDSPGDRPPLVASAYDDEFSDGSIASKWAWRNQGTATVVEANGITVVASESTPGGNSLKIREQAAPAGDFTVTAKVVGNGGGNESGICLINSVSGKIITLDVISNGHTKFNRWNSATSFNVAIVDTTSPELVGVVYLRLGVVGTTITAYYSYDGVTFEKLSTTTEAIATFLGTVRADLDKIGFFTDGFGPDVSVDVHWFRVV